MTTAIIVIPARFPSQRFPGKPLADIGGRSMIQRVWERSCQSALASRVIVATDDERIVEHVSSLGGEAVMTPPELASGSERVAWAAAGTGADVVVNVQGDEPLIDPGVIDAVIAPFFDGVQTDMTTAASPIMDAGDLDNPNIVKAVCAADGHALYFSRAAVPHVRDADPAGGRVGGSHLKHIGIYGFTATALRHFATLPESPLERLERLEQLRALEAGMRIHVVRVAYDSIAVDIPADVDRVLDAMRLRGLR